MSQKNESTVLVLALLITLSLLGTGIWWFTSAGGIYYASAPEVVPQCGIKSLPVGREVNQLIPAYQKPFVPLSQCPSKRNQLNSEAFRSGQYPITRRLFVIVKQNGQDDQLAGETYAKLLLTNQGQDLIAKTGFIRLR